MRSKLGPSHLERRAYVYVRQSSLAQVHHHVESTKRQYALADRAIALGWTAEQIEVIDEDQGKSGSTRQGRGGFAELVEAVAHGKAGAIFALEVSRLARSSEDWQRLLSLCAVAGVMVLDEQATYDPGDKDDKLLLDIKGTMSEAELHWLGLRLTGARQNKARRGALRIPAPTGYVWAGQSLEKDPDEAVRRAVDGVFARYAVEPSVWAVIRWARKTGLQFPTRHWYVDDTTVTEWKPLGMSRLHEILKNPIYAGVYAYGRRPTKKVLVDGEIRRHRMNGSDPAQWAVRIEDAHPGYITWETYVKNQEKLRDNLTRKGRTTRGAAREGDALLCGLLVCARCGRRMATSYGSRLSRRWYYVCGGARDQGQTLCWTTPGQAIDRAVETLFLNTMVPSELDLSLGVERVIGSQARALEEQWRARVEQCTYEARHAERRYKAVDPDNRVVARNLERDWEQRLRDLEQVEQQYRDARREHRVELTEQDRERIRALARDLPKVWRSPVTPATDRKAMLRLVVEAIAVSPVDVPQRATRVRVAWKSGAVTELIVARPDRRQRLRTPEHVVARLGAFAAAGMRDEDIADALNAEGLRTGRDRAWNVVAVKWTRRRESIPRVAPDAPRTQPLPERDEDGRYSIAGAARQLGVSVDVIRRCVERGWLAGERKPYANHKSTWWIRLDDAAEARVREHVHGVTAKAERSK